MTASGLASQPCRSDLQTLQTRFSPIPLTWLPTSPLCSLAGPAPRLPLPLSFLTLLFLSCLSPSHWWLLESPRLCPQLTPRWYLTDVSADQPLLPWPWSPTQTPVYSEEAEEPGWSGMQAAPCLPRLLRNCGMGAPELMGSVVVEYGLSCSAACGILVP